MSGKITITNHSPSVAIIDIEGIIGVPEEWQFEEPGQRVTCYEKFRSVLESIRAVDSSEIIVNIRSTGGNVNDALLIFDALKSMDSKITTKCFGYVASAATIIAQAASQGQREISANSLYLIHRSISSAEGNAENMAQTIDLLERTDKRISSLYASRANRPDQVYEDLMSENNGNGRWLAPSEVLEYGLADRVIASTPIQKDAAEVVVNLGLPPLPQKKDSKLSKLSRRWSAILDVLGINDLRDMGGNIGSDQSKKDLSCGVDQDNVQMEIISAHTKQVEELKNKINSLEAENARLSVFPTQTELKEDPSADEVYLSANEMAYGQDIRNFNN